jgi:hypothetical protein
MVSLGLVAFYLLVAALTLGLMNLPEESKPPLIVKVRIAIIV